MFYGKKVKKIDKKGRISFSKKVRETLGDNPLILKRSDRVRIYPEEEIEKFKPSQVFPTKFDKQGRILILTKLGFQFLSVFLVGCGDYLEIRPRKKISYHEMTLKEAEELNRRGIAVICDGDKKMVVLWFDK